MRRFWREARAVVGAGGWGITLDGRPVKTPARAELTLPTAALAEAVAGEWTGAGETVDPRAMPLTGLANAAIDRVAADRDGFAASLARYAESDLLCYRAEAPAELVARQARAWDPLLGWARRRFDVDFAITAGVAPVRQPEATVARLGQAVAALDPFALAGLSPLVSIGGSLVTALALAEDAVGLDDAWAAVSLDEQWQLDRWGADAEACAALASRKRDFAAAKQFLELVGRDEVADEGD